MARHPNSSFVGGRLCVGISPELQDEVRDLLATRFGLEPEDFTVVDLEYVFGHQVIEFLRSERFLRYVDRDAKAGEYDELDAVTRSRMWRGE